MEWWKIGKLDEGKGDGWGLDATITGKPRRDYEPGFTSVMVTRRRLTIE